MHSHVSLNDQILPATEARIHAVTGTTFYGRGVWTTIAVTRATPFLWQAHWARLIAHAAQAGVDASSLDEAATRAQLDRLIAHNNVETGRARLSLLAKSTSGAWRMTAHVKSGELSARDDNDRADDTRGDDDRTDVLIVTGDARQAPEEGFALTVSPHRLNTHSPLAGLKTTNYLEHIIAWEEAHARHFDEAVMLNERGEIVSATLANLFWTTDGTLRTPALACGALNGTTRAVILELADELAIPFVESAYDLAHLGDADEIFLTSSGVGVAFCAAFDFRRYTLTAGSIALRLREALRQRMLQA
jgi:branched-subunit amino acid aminotransferase/4-amino-4-deoxychorismate lyase